MPECTDGQVFLVYLNGTWYITSDEGKELCFLWDENNEGGFVRLISEGLLVSQERHSSMYASF